MKIGLLIYLLLVSAVLSAQTKRPSSAVSSRTIHFDDSWLFIKDSIANAEQANFNDAKWRKVELPHDWSIEDLPNQIPDSIVGPFSKAAVSKHASGFLVGGTAWYRKHFVLDKISADKKVFIQFDGVYMNADVWINGHHLGNHPYGYTSFYYDLTPFLLPPGQSNSIAVQVKNEGRNSLVFRFWHLQACMASHC